MVTVEVVPSTAITVVVTVPAAASLTVAVEAPPVDGGTARTEFVCLVNAHVHRPGHCEVERSRGIRATFSIQCVIFVRNTRENT